MQVSLFEIFRRTLSIWLSIFLFCVPYLAQTSRLFPDLKTVSDFSPINSSSTCGNPEIKVCRSLRDVSSLDVCTEDTCKFSCCDSCGSSKPIPRNIGKTKPLRPTGITDGTSKPGSSDPSLTFASASNSHIDILVLPAIEHVNKGFTISVWIKQKTGNKGTLVSKCASSNPYKVIFQLEIENYKIWFHYQYQSRNTSVAELAPLQSQSQNLKPNEWHLITVTVINTDLSYFIDDQFIAAEVLKGSINDHSGRVRIGQKYGGGSQYEGLMQDVFLYSISLTNREVVEAFSGVLPKAYVSTQCRCPPGYPKIMETSRTKCTKNGLSAAGQSKLRLADTAHPVELATDGDSTTYWQSEITNSATVYLDLKYGELQILYIILEFYGPQPSAIKIERSRDQGLTYKPWQYFAENCRKSFNMDNNGDLPQPDSVNCIQYELPLKASGAYVSFKTEQPPPDGSSIPARPFGSPCTNLYCSVKLLEFLKASYVRFSFYNHTLVKNEKHKYFALYRIVVAGRCECFGHAKKATYIQGNATHRGKCVCHCHASTFTEGDKCNRCLPLYNNKPFRRGANTNSYPCLKCQCNQHALSCYYNKTLDIYPNTRNQGGGGVCVDCKHNTTGRYCHKCKENYYREKGKSLSAIDVCTPCSCTGPGVQDNSLDCVKDDTKPGVTAGQCQCKQFTQGRQCSQCKPGYFDLKSSHLTGCVTCGCNTAGTINANKTCHASTGECDCKSDVTGLKCDTCRPGFYGLDSLQPTGCKNCNCDPFGTQNGTVCDPSSGQCKCKIGSTGRQCGDCDDGFHSQSVSGCKTCNCSKVGSNPLLVNKCNKDNGQCYCKTYTEGKQCDRCQSGYFNLSSSNPDGCIICTCDPKGTIWMSRQCETQTGNCSCKRYVVGKNCNQCQQGTYNLSLSNPEGCQKCNCFVKGTQIPQSGGVLGCSSNGQCTCLSNVEGKQCNSCIHEYYWNPTGKGCVACNCNTKGSTSKICNTTGQCSCKPNISGLRCDRCSAGNYGFHSGTCQPCGCNLSGSLNNGCDDSGKCASCKKNVEGNKCDKCKSGTINLQSNNTFGCSGVPSDQAPPFVTVISSRILSVTWNQPDNPNGIIDRYELYRNGSLVYKGLNRALNDTGLTPNSFYFYFILTYTEAGHTRSFHDNRIYKTPQDKPENIAPPTISNVKARTAKAAWTEPLVTNGAITNYRLVSVNSRSLSEVEHCKGLIFSCDVSDLKPFTTYNFTVVACNYGGCGRSEPRIVKTREASPDFQPMPNITLISGGESVVVNWDEPPVPNGKVFRYDLYMRATPFSGPGNVVSPSSPIDVRNMRVSNLIPFTFYEFRVVAYTAEVNGATSSSWKRVRTAEGDPSGESAISPQSTAISSDSIKITWNEPSKPKGIIVRYTIKVVKPPKELLANGTDRSLVVNNFKPYTSYTFTVSACNSYRCTGESASTSTRTLASAPENQGSPTVANVDSHLISLKWARPGILNGPFPPSYNITRVYAAFNEPPQEVTAGVHFPGLGYYKLLADVITPDARNDIEFYFRTQHPYGLILFLASDGSQDDLIAVDLREGKPWLVFDCQTGPAAVTVSGNTRFDDNQWHQVKITRRNRDATMTIDGRYSGSGSSVGPATTISGYTAVYVGGLPDDFKIKRLDTGNAVVARFHFIGCLKNFKSNNIVFDWKKALKKHGVEPERNACPIEREIPGALLRGGGFITINSNVLVGKTFFPFEMTFRTQIKSGLLAFAYGPSSYIALLLKNGKVNIKLQGTNNKTSYEFPSSSVCDGSWHEVKVLSISSNGFFISVNNQNQFIQGIVGIKIESLYVGGVPLDNKYAVEKAKNAGVNPDETFSGCIKYLLTNRKISLSRDVIKIRNVDLDGCVSDTTINSTLLRGACLSLNTVNIVTQKNEQFNDTSVMPFTDYLYRVSSFHQGTRGSSKSSWISTRSGPGAPTGISAPISVTALKDGRSAIVVWSRPKRPNGLITAYFIIARKRLKPSDQVVKKVNNVETLKDTIRGLTPYTLYDIQIAAFTWGGNGTGPSVNITTKQAVPEDVPFPTALRLPRALLLTWTEPASPNGIITRYNLTVDNEIVYSGVDQHFNVTDLNVYQLYSIQLTACTIVGCSSGRKKSIRTGELPPEGLSLPTLEVKSNESIRVQWDIPTRPNGRITGYEIHLSITELLGPGYRMVYNGTRSDLSTLITGLVTGTLYYVRVKAFTGGGGTFSNASSARTLSGLPSDIPAPILTALTPYSIHVRILPPQKPNGIITRYELYQDIIVLPVLNTTVLSNYTADGFKVYSLHYFYVIACTKIGCNPSKTARGFTGELAPNGTIKLTASIISSRKIRARWTSVAQPNGQLFYHLVIEGKFLVPGSAVSATEIRRERVLGNPDTEMIYSRLLPYNSYKFWVNASNSKGFILSNSESGNTPEDAPEGLLPPKANFLSSTSINVTWQRPYQPNGVLLAYTLYQKIQNNETDLYTGLDMSFLVTGLEPFTRYLFRVSARTAKDTGYGNWSEFWTLEDIPDNLDAPRLSPDSKSMLLEWDHPPKPNGIIVQYSIYMNGSLLLNVTGNTTKYRVMNLKPFTPYTFAITACTIVGCIQSQYSKARRTLQSVPSGLSQPLVKALSPRTVEIQWEVPNITNGIIISYSIYRLKVGQQVPVKVGSVNASEPRVYIDRTVQPFTFYKYRVVAFTSIGGGTPSEYSNVTTGEGDPEKIKAPQVTALSSSSLKVNWARPEIPNGHVINYIVRVLETGYTFSMNSSAVFQYIITGLKPFTPYSIVIRVCTIGGCGESSKTEHRTLPDLPSGQQAPTSSVLSSTSLRVKWRTPTDANSVIWRYELYRRTIDEPVNENFTESLTFVKVYSGIGYTYDDTDLGIYSLQRYKVTVFTSTGKTTSPTADYRTGAASPLDGPVVNATAVNHTTIVLSWSSPNVRRLRGPVESYTVFYEQIINSIVYRYGSVPRNTTILAVTGLKPSTKYKFWVTLDNGAGNATSDPVLERTLDGAPEGFGAPNLFTKSSTEIRVNWDPPTTPNGQIVLYKVFGNSKLLANASANSRYVTLSGLIPYTNYNIQVEVCTVYGCTKSPVRSIRTEPAAPEGLAPPCLTPGPNFMVINWDPPARSNGIIMGYKIFRRKIHVCPTSKPPVTKCSYVECNISQSLCGSTCYDPTIKICCDGVLHQRDRSDPNKRCCGNSYVRKNNVHDVCCGNTFHIKQNNFKCCFNNYMRVPSGSVCCQRVDGGVVIGFGDSCCGDLPYSVNGSKVCVCDGLFERSPPRQCCGGKVVASAQICCGTTKAGKAYDIDSTKVCCGTQYVTEKTTLCCKGHHGIAKVYNYSSFAVKNSKAEKCCNTNKVSFEMSCCNTNGYNSSYQTCADRSSVAEKDCGTGVVCNMTNRNAAKCNRCDFPSSKRICGFVNGYFRPTSAPVVPEVCATEFQQVYSNLNKPNTLTFKDKNLSPHTEYEYYLVAVNSEGTVNSSFARNRTQMASPDGLDPPVATAISSSAIRVTWKPPKVSNGILMKYTLIRIKKQSGQRKLVYSGLKLAFTDNSGLEPFTGYVYELQACTTDCTAALSNTIAYTKEAIPSIVNPPSLEALSPTSMNVSWSLPPKPNGIIIRYNVSQIINSTHRIRLNPDDKGLDMFKIVTNLKPYQNCTFQVVACTKIGCKEGSPASMLTLEAAPQGVWPPVLMPLGAREIEASWSKPDVPNGVIAQYSLYRNDTLVYNGTGVCSGSAQEKVKCIYKDTRLKPMTIYSYEVSATTRGGTTRSNSSSAQTPESAPEGVPLPRLRARSAYIIEAEWDAPQIPNGVITQYAILVDGNEYNAGLNKSKVIGGLKPFTKYAFRVKACTGKGQSKGCAIGNEAYAKTSEAPPSGINVPYAEAKEWNIVYVSWSQPTSPNGIITEYRVERRLPPNNQPQIVCLTSGSSLTRRNCLDSTNSLKGYTVYEYRVFAKNGGGIGNGPWTSVRTLEGPPRGIKQPTVITINATAVNVKWQAPLEPNGIITHYEVRYQPLNVVDGNISVAGRVDSKTYTMTVSVLKANTDYQFLITAINKRHQASSTWAFAKTKEAPPTDVKALSAERLSGGTSLRLFWNQPGNPNGIISKYNIYKDDIKVYEGKIRQYIVIKLTPYTPYEFQLEACTSAGCTKGARQTIYSAEINPSGQAPPSSEFVNATVVVLAWRPPAVPNGAILRYDVVRTAENLRARYKRALNENIVHSTTNTNATRFRYVDTSLKPYTKYKYKIRAVNKGGHTDSDWLIVNTGQAPPSTVIAPVVLPLDAYQLNVTWRMPSQPNGIMQYYLVHRNGTISYQGSELYFVDVRREPYTIYSYTVTACSGGGCTVSKPTSQRTNEAAPAQVTPPTLKALSAIAIRITWSMPIKPNGRITGYKVYENTIANPLYSGKDKHFTVSAKKPYTEYTFYIEACTMVGCTKSKTSTVRTLQSPPGVMGAPVATIAGSRHVRVEWNPPAQPNGNILYYILTRDLKVVYNGSDVRYDDYNVAPYTQYSYRVTAYNKAGRGIESSVGRNPPTDPSAPENVTAPVLTVVNATSMRVVWKEPERPNGVITKYFILYNTQEIDAALSKDIVLNSLEPFTLYTVRIRACTTACTVGERTQARTLEAAPQLQSYPVIPTASIKEREVHIIWSKPDKPNGFIIRYTLERRQVYRFVGGQLSYGTVTIICNKTNGTLLAFTDQAVKPYSEYEYRVTSANSIASTTSGWALVRTLTGVPENIPKPKIVKAYQDKIEVLIRAPLQPNGEIRNYVIKVSGKNFSTGLEMSRVVSNLEPYTTYRFSIYACTDAGCATSPEAVADTTEGTPSKFSAPRIVKLTSRSAELEWDEPAKPNGIIRKYEVLHRISCAKSCELPPNSTKVGLQRNAYVTGLQPYLTYDFIIRVFNDKYSGLSEVKSGRTLPEDPDVRPNSPPRVNVTGYHVSVDWSNCFILNGPVDGYTLLERGVIVFLGEKTSAGLPNRERGEYTYEVLVTTIVNGQKKVARSPKVNVMVPNEGVIEPHGTTQPLTDPVYRRIWFIAVMALIGIILVFVIFALCLRKRSGDRTVYVREREPLPPRTKMHSRPSSMSSLYSGNGKGGSMMDLNMFNSGSQIALFENGGRMTPRAERYNSMDRYERYNRYNKSMDLTNGSVHKYGDESSDFIDHPQTYNKDSGLYLDGKEGYSDSDEESTPRQYSYKKEQYFTDTHL